MLKLFPSWLSAKRRFAGRARPLGYLPRLESLEARAVPAAAFADFNNDGYDDLACFVDRFATTEPADSGGVVLIYGSATGLRHLGATRISQETLGLDTNEAGDSFGAALAAGDFNGDGRTDLAIGSPGENGNAGAVYLVNNSSTGLKLQSAVRWTPDSAYLQQTNERQNEDRFGIALAVGDFDGDGKQDLAVGAPGGGVAYEAMPPLPPGGETRGYGVVHVFYGTAIGLSISTNQCWKQGNTGTLETAEAHDWFGMELATGDFNGDLRDDLAIGVPGEKIGSLGDPGTYLYSGAVEVLYGSASRLSSSGSQFWSQATTGVVNDPEELDYFGLSLAAGDFMGDFRDELAIGVPGESIWAGDSVHAAGLVHVLRGSAGRLTSSDSQWWTEASLGVATSAEDNEIFGHALAAADFDGNGKLDLAISAPGGAGVGRVHLLLGSLSALTANNQSWTGDSFADSTAQSGDLFGNALTVGRFDGDSRPDLAIGVPGYDSGGVTDVGAVRVMFGGTDGLSAARADDLLTLVVLGFFGIGGAGFGNNL